MTRFALNHMVMPARRFAEFAASARRLGVTDVEIRNDLPGVEIADGTPPAEIRRQAEQTGVRILAINALQRFDNWNDTRAAEAAALARYARECGAGSLVLCPVNDRADPRPPDVRARDLRTALTALAPILRNSAITGLIEPLGFPESALRTKRPALDAVDATRTTDTFALLHDTFHHFLSGETELFAARTMLVHVSGVVDPALPLTSIRDKHRVLVIEHDRLGTLSQLRALHAGGYTGPVSLEPFAPGCDDHTGLQACLALLRSAVRSEQP
ncbi:MAG: TIM barrel protein [Acetobacteraceae bacterium]|nr:TIM barrel protein [Acetobacteraceae bacterium]